MSIASAKKIEVIAQAKDPKQAIFDAVGDLTGVEVFSDLVLVGTFIRNEKTAGGIIMPTSHLQEDEFQGKVGLVLKSGPLAWLDGENEPGSNARPGTWVVYAIKDGWPVQINGTACRFVPYEKLRARVADPKAVF
jgi:co-chaperonin GroES (HSP10)